MNETLLCATGLSMRFGGLSAVNNVSLELRRDQIHALIGPNGAGKSTLTNLLSGDLLPSSGQISLCGTDITGWRAEQISRQGLARSYQKTNIFLPFTVWDNIHLAALSRDSQQAWNPLRWLQNANHSSAAHERSTRAIELSGLKNRRQAIAGSLSHGEQRQLEIAMTLATEPQVLLLDEPLAGMGAAESQRLVELMLHLKTDHAILLVEHDMDAVFTLADHLTVMLNGRVIASASPAAVRADTKVQAAYLGEAHT